MVVPFRNRAMIGVGLGESDEAPDFSRFKSGKPAIKEIAELMDRVPALPPKLIELGHWISRYYVAPIGEAFRAMLPPEIELRSDREYSLTDAGRAYLQELSAAMRPRKLKNVELNCCGISKKGSSASRPCSSRARAEAAAEKLVRRGYATAREVLRSRGRARRKLSRGIRPTPKLTSAAEKKSAKC